MGSVGNNVSAMTKSERLAAVRREVESGTNTSSSELSKKYNLSMAETGQIVYEYTSKQSSSPQIKTTPVKSMEKKTSTKSKTSSSKRIESMTDSLRNNPNSTLIGTSGNTTYVIEASKVAGSYTRPNGVRVPTSKTVYSVTPFTKGSNYANTRMFNNQEELNSYMKGTGAKWKSRKNKLSNRQKDKLFD